MGQTIPSPSPDERQRAKSIIEQGAVEALAFILAENRWLSNILHNRITIIEEDK